MVTNLDHRLNYYSVLDVQQNLNSANDHVTFSAYRPTARQRANEFTAQSMQIRQLNVKIIITQYRQKTTQPATKFRS